MCTGEVPAVELTADEQVRIAVSHAAQQRAWLRTLTPLLQLRSQTSDPSGRVQLALDPLHIAACERAARLLCGDLPGDES